MDKVVKKCGFPLESVPIIIVEGIAQYVSTKDLAMCCASRYNRAIVEYPLNTPCKVSGATCIQAV